MRSALCACLCLLVGCVPIPHRDHHAPALDIRLMDGGAPLALTEVTLAVNAPSPDRCDGDQVRVGSTDGQGAVSFALQSQISWLMVFGDRLDTWRICVQAPGAEQVYWTGHGWWGGPPSQQLACDIQGFEPVGGGDAGWSLGCEVVQP